MSNKDTAVADAPRQHPADYKCNRNTKVSDYLNVQWTGERKDTAQARKFYGQALDARAGRNPNRRDEKPPRKVKPVKYRPGALR